MSWRLHHTNVTAYDVARSTEWYTNVIGLTPRPPSFETGHGKGRDIAWFEVDGSAQLHLSAPVRNFARDNGFHLDPISRGHVAIEVDDLEVVKQRLRERDMYFADPGNWALKDYMQIYVLDPSGNCVEVNQQM